MLIVGAIDNRN